MAQNIDLIRVTFLSLLLFGSILQSSRSQDDAAKKVDLEVFYSPFESGSSRLLQSQVFAVINSALGKFVKVKMYPVTSCKIKMTTGDAAHNKLSCTGGANEEKAVLHHLCAIDILNKASKVEGKPPLSLSYVVCTLERSSMASQLNFEGCRNNAKDYALQIEACISKADDNLVASAVDRLNEVNPHYSPFIVINGKHNSAQDDEAKAALWKVVCRVLGQGSPSDCRNITAREPEADRIAEEDAATIPVFLPCFLLVPVFSMIFL